jgi:glycerol-3-phosphate acyltransferase PlsX
MRLAIDVMGGDNAPNAILEGAFQALDVIEPDDELVLVGPEDVIRPVLDERGVGDSRISIEHASQVIGMHEAPARAVRSKTDSSIVRMAKLSSPRAANPVDAVMSAGNTGACVSAAIMYLKRLKGVHRPGIAVTIPAFHGPVILCDAGANPEPKPSHLWQYALMAETYAKQVLGVVNPRVALMNIGSEEAKGSQLIRETRDMLKATPGLNYSGYIEGRGFFAGEADVIITDGFVGNTVLKMAEGLAASIFAALGEEIGAIDPGLAKQFAPIVRQMYAKNDYHETGGAPLLGVNGVFSIAHGSSQPRTIRAAIRNTLQYARAHVNEAVIDRLERAGQPLPEPA